MDPTKVAHSVAPKVGKSAVTTAGPRAENSVARTAVLLAAWRAEQMAARWVASTAD